MKKILASAIVCPFLLLIPSGAFASSIATYIANTKNADDGLTFCQEYDNGTVYLIWHRREQIASPILSEESLQKRAMIQYEGASSARQSAYNVRVPTCTSKFFARFNGKTRNIRDAEAGAPPPIVLPIFQ